jgi:hypothetical protein
MLGRELRKQNGAESCQVHQLGKEETREELQQLQGAMQHLLEEE